MSTLGELVPCGGGDPIPLLKSKLLIGRRRQCDIHIEFPNVSSQHCQLELLNGYWFVRDLGSRNGIKVNGVRCDSKWMLPGDVLSIAKHRFELLYTPTADGPPPEDEDPFALSLLEKAGLMKRREQDEPAAAGAAPRVRPAQARPAPTRGAATDDELALDYLNDED